MLAAEFFQACVQAVSRGVLIERENRLDKEFHFQNWVKARLGEVPYRFEVGGRNSYPDFRFVELTVGIEVKGLAYPGRDASFDSNSQVPSGFHNGRTIYYAFGRYPKQPDGDSYPVLDLVVCHGDLLNADHEYVHKNKSVRCFGSYGDILIRDRKMYVVPTPYRVAEGLAHHLTLVLPAEQSPGTGFAEVGKIVRRESAELIVGYAFNLLTNDLRPETVPNPSSGLEHTFRAWRLAGSPTTGVANRPYEVGADDGECDADD